MSSLGSPRPLDEGLTLAVWAPGPGVPVFTSQGKWLHPLFDLEEFLGGRPDLDPEYLEVRDRVIGRAAAFLMVRLGLTNVGADVVSQGAVQVFEDAGVAWWAGQTVERIGCQTEALLAEMTDVQDAWALVSERRRRALAKELHRC